VIEVVDRSKTRARIGFRSFGALAAARWPDSAIWKIFDSASSSSTDASPPPGASASSAMSVATEASRRCTDFSRTSSA
jgi:hypothetical protein